MSYIIRPTRDLSWLAAQTNGGYTTRAKGIEAVNEKTGEIGGMLGYDAFTHNAAQISIAIKHPLCIPRLYGPALEYPFKELNKNVLIGMISSANERSYKFAEEFGFVYNTQIADAILPGVHLIIMELRKEDWLLRRSYGVTWRRHPQSARQGSRFPRLSRGGG